MGSALPADGVRPVAQADSTHDSTAGANAGRTAFSGAVTFWRVATLYTGVVTMTTDSRSAVAFENADLTDGEVIRQVLDGNTAIFELLMRRYNERVYRAARSIVRGGSAQS